MRQMIRITFFLAYVLYAPFCLAAPSQVALPVPPNATPEIIASDMRFNGAPMQIVQFDSLDAKETLKYYRKFFEENAKEGKFSETPTSGGIMIGALMGERIVNIEIQSQTGEAAKILVSSIEPKLTQSPEKLASDIPRMPGSQVIQHQDSRDGDKKNRFVIMRNKQSIEGNAMYLREHYIGAGWKRDNDDTLQPAQHRQLQFSKNNNRLLVDIQRTAPDTVTVIYSEMTE